MDRTTKLSFALLALAGCIPAAEPSAAAKKAVLAAEKEWVAAVIAADRATLDKMLTADLSYTHSSAKTQTKEEFLKDATGGSTTYKSIEFEGDKLRQFGNTVVLTHTAVITTVQTGASHLFLTEVWVQEGGRWQMASRQATKLPQ